MYRIEELEELISCTYPNQVSNETQARRRTDIIALQDMIQAAIDENTLEFAVQEERLEIFQTLAGEKIFIQYPGKESTETGTNRRPYDFRPRIMTSNGEMVRDLVFADMWGLVEDLNKQQHQMLKLMACIFFRMGRMLFHDYVEKDYQCELLDQNENVIGKTVRHLSWYEFNIDSSIMESLNFHSPRLHIDGNVEISLEAFVCFFELLLQNEDSKYYDKKKNLSSGRIPTSDSMLLLSSALYGKIRLSVLLQRFVSGFGVARCMTNEIETATDGLVVIVNRKKELLTFFEEQHIGFRVGASITVEGTSYRIAIKVPKNKIAILSQDNTESRLAISSKGWTVFTLDDLLDEGVFCSIKETVMENETSENI